MTPHPEPIASVCDAPPSEALYFKGHLGLAVAGVLLPMDALAPAPGSWTGPQLMLQLAKAEPLVSAVEQWQQAPWNDLTSCTLSCDASDLATWCEAVVCAPALAPVGTRLRLPWSALRAAPPPWLQAPHVVWPSMAAEVCIDHLHGDELDGLTPGSLLWLTPSFGTDWPVALRDPLHRLPHCHGQWKNVQASSGALTLGPFGADKEIAPVPCATPQEAAGLADVVLAGPLSLPLEHWLGWSPTVARSIALPLTAQNLSVQVRHAGAVRASGGLLSLGRGHAFKVEATASDPFRPPGQTH